MARKGFDWTTQVDDRRIELLSEGYSYQETAYILSTEFKSNISKYMVIERGRKTKTTKSELGVKNLSSDELFNLEEKEVDLLFPEEAYKISDDLLFAPEKMRRLKEIWDMYNDGKPKKILSLSDLHAPFINFAAVEKAIKEHSDADVLVLNGDVFDGHALSDFDKMNDFDIELEFKQVFMLLDVVTKMFNTVVWNSGNHDGSRFIRFVARKFGQGMKKYVLKRLNPITYISEKYKNLVIVPHQFVQIGNVIFNHPDGYSSALMSTALSQTEILNANRKEILPNPEFECLIQGHTHDMGDYYLNDIKVIEQGCLTITPDYRVDKPTKRKWITGYAVAYLDENGNVDFNKTRSYIIK